MSCVDETGVKRLNSTAGTDLNLPVSGVAALLVVLFLKLRTPEGSLLEKLARMDWV